MTQGRVTVDITGDERRLRKSLDRAEGAIGKFGKAAKKTLVLIAAGFAFKKLLQGAGVLLDLYTQQEEAETRLESVLRATGNAAGFSAEKMKELANAIGGVTTFGDEAVMNAQAIIATFKNIRGDEFKEATMLAADMASVLGGDLKGSVMQVAKALNDPIKGVSALSRAGVSFTQQQKDMITSLVESGQTMKAQQVILAELRGEFGGAAKAAGETFTGRLKRLKNAAGDAAQGFVKGLLPAFEAVIPIVEKLGIFVQNVTNHFADNTTWIGRWAEVAVKWFKDISVWVTEKLILGFTVLEVAIENWQTRSERGVLKFQLTAIQVFENIKRYFTEILPKALSWFSRNWVNILRDVASFQGRVLFNMGKNVLNFTKAVADALKGKGFNFEFTALTDGFQATIEKLPKFAERVVSAQEKVLRDRIQELDNEFKGQVQARFEENVAAFNSLFESKQQDVKDIKADLEFEEAKIDTKKKPPKKQKADKEEDVFQASVESLEALNTRIAAAAASEKKEGKLLAQGKELIAKVGDVGVVVGNVLKDSHMAAAAAIGAAFKEAFLAKAQLEELKKNTDAVEQQAEVAGKQQQTLEELLGMIPAVGALK